MANRTIPDTPPPEKIVRAALERAAETADSIALPMDGRLAKAQAHYMRSVIRDTTRALASDPAEVAAIISAASQLNKAGDEIKEQRDEEDRG